MTQAANKPATSLFDIERAITIIEFDITTTGTVITYSYAGNEKTFLLSGDDMPEYFEKIGFIDKWLATSQRVKYLDDDTLGYRYVDYLDWMDEQRWTSKDALRMVGQHEWDLAAYRMQQEIINH